jgi:hypothetical protein
MLGWPVSMILRSSRVLSQKRTILGYKVSAPRADRSVKLCALAAVVVLTSSCTSTKSSPKSAQHSTTTAETTSGLAGADGESSTPATEPTPSPTPIKTGPVTVGAVTETPADSCPYIDTQAAADAEGNRIGAIIILSIKGQAMGCRFRFQYSDRHYILEITSAGYATQTTAHNAMVIASRVDPNAFSEPAIAAGVEAVLYRTTFYAPDGNRDWACAFTKGRTVVTVKTDQTDTSTDALNMAKLIVGKF